MASAEVRDALEEEAAAEGAALAQTRRAARRRRVWQWLRKNNDDNFTTLLLAAAALATSWSAYQASIWGGIQASQYTLANDSRTEALGAADSAARLQLVDFALFNNWITAYANHHDLVRRFYESQFRPEFRPAFRVWRSTLTELDSVSSSPFALPEYQVAAANEAARLQEKSTALFESGQAANSNSDSYVFDTVILALVLFFASTARQIVSSRARAFIILTSFLLLFWSVVRIVTSPVAH